MAQVFLCYQHDDLRDICFNAVTYPEINAWLFAKQAGLVRQLSARCRQFGKRLRWWCTKWYKRSWTAARDLDQTNGQFSPNRKELPIGSALESGHMGHQILVPWLGRKNLQRAESADPDHGGARACHFDKHQDSNREWKTETSLAIRALEKTSLTVKTLILVCFKELPSLKLKITLGF